MNPPSGWFVSPSEERAALAADLLAREKVHEFRTWSDQLVARAQLRSQLQARQQLRDRMAMIVTIDRAGTERAIESESVG